MIRLAGGLRALALAGVLLVPCQGGTIFNISGPNYAACDGSYALPSTTTCNQPYHISGSIVTDVSIAEVVAIGNGDFDLAPHFSLFSFTDGSATTVTQANIFTLILTLRVTSGAISGWNFILLDSSGLTFDSGTNTYSGTVTGLGSTFTPGNIVDLTQRGFNCTGLVPGTFEVNCESIMTLGLAPSQFDELSWVGRERPGFRLAGPRLHETHTVLGYLAAKPMFDALRKEARFYNPSSRR